MGFSARSCKQGVCLSRERQHTVSTLRILAPLLLGKDLVYILSTLAAEQDSGCRSLVEVFLSLVAQERELILKRFWIVPCLTQNRSFYGADDGPLWSRYGVLPMMMWSSSRMASFSTRLVGFYRPKTPRASGCRAARNVMVTSARQEWSS